MHVVLLVTSEIQDPEKIVLRPGQCLSVGRTELNDVTFSGDAQMAHEHFLFEFSAGECRVKNLKQSNITTINGQPVDGQVQIHDGDEIVAGQTRFQVSIEGVPKSRPLPSSEPAEGNQTTASSVASANDVSHHENQFATGAELVSATATAGAVGLEQTISTQPEHQPAEHAWTATLPDLPFEGVKASVYEHFTQLPQPLFAILDAARDSMVRALLMQSDLEYQSLYEGPKGEELSEVAPYLVKLPSESRWLKRLIEWGWGESWGIFLASDQSFKDIRKHFRQFLMVETEEGKELYFRFYDPRVLRVYLPTCTPEEAQQFFGPVASYFMEGPLPKDLLQFGSGQTVAKQPLLLKS